MSGWGDRLRERLVGIDHMRAIHWIDERIVERPGRVILLFLIVTIPFLFGMGLVSMESGTQQFTSGLPAEEALQQIDQEFSGSFETPTGSTSVIQQGGNVLSKPNMVRMLEVEESYYDRSELRVHESANVATLVALEIDDTAVTAHRQKLVLERAPDARIREAIRNMSDNPELQSLVSNDFNAESASASATMMTVTHNLTQDTSAGAGQGGESPLTPIQQQMQRIADDTDGDFTVFGQGVVADEFSAVVVDSLLIVVPAALLLILLFLSIAYRDPFDLLLGLFCLFMAIIWTFGFTGLAGIPFTQMLIAVPPLLLAVGIDFGIHAVNRYREERIAGHSIDESMRITTDQLVVAFFMVTGTTVVGFAANFSSPLAPIREFGLVASVGIVFTFLIFGIFLPAAKVWLDRVREDSWIPEFAQSPMGSSGSTLGRVLAFGVVIARRAPGIFLIVVLLVSVWGGAYATGINTEFSQEDFLPPDETPAFLDQLPEPFRPSDYTVSGTIDFLERNFESTNRNSVTVYLERRMIQNSALESIDTRNQDPPGSIVMDDERQAEAQSILSVIETHAEHDEEFRELVEREDTDDDGIPNRNLEGIYQALENSHARNTLHSYLAEDYRSARIVYSVEADASQTQVDSDAREMAERFRGTAIATGQLVVFKAVSDLILESALTSLVIALIGAALFLVFIYLVLEGRASLGIANLIPILVTVAMIAASMRYLGIAFNALTATILAVTIGLGIDYSVHVTHRFADEREKRKLLPALQRTVYGTGGALLGSMLTTVSGIGVLALAVFPAIGQFGIITALSIVYAFLASVYVLPAVLVVWDGLVNQDASFVQLLAPSLGGGSGDADTQTYGEGSASAGGRDIMDED